MRVIAGIMTQSNGGIMMQNNDGNSYVVVKNHEEQYSIWRDGRPLPAGWYAEGYCGPREACLAYIESVWTDMRPLSLREALAEQASGEQAE